MKPWDVTVVGEIYIDHVFSGFPAWPQPGEEVVTDAYTREVGGGAATTACGLARLGRKVNLIGVIGQTDTAWFEHRMSEFGLSLSGLRKSSGASGVTVAVSTFEDRSFFTHIGVNNTLHEILTSDSALAEMESARHVHFSMPLSTELAAVVLPLLHEAGCTTSLDVGFQPAWLSDPAHHDLLRGIDHLLPNEKEAALLCGDTGEDAYFRFAEHLNLRSPMLKLGARGAMAKSGDAVCHAPPPKVVARDTTGAGDAFNVGFIDGLLDDISVKERLQRACITGALSTRAAGALGGLPDREEFWRIYEHTY